MIPFLEKITGSHERVSLESRIYNALTFFTPFAALFVIPLAFMLKLSAYHVASILMICVAGFYCYYLSRFKKTKSNLFLIIFGLTLLSVIWISGYGSVGYAFLFYQFILIFSQLVLEKKLRVIFFHFIAVLIVILLLMEYSGFIVPMRYNSEKERSIDFLINFLVWFIFTGIIIRVIIDNFRKERELLDDDLAVAQQLQLRLLPESIPQIPGYSIYTCYLPMHKVGGDFYDCRVDDDTIEMMIADVSGHGLPGAFLAAITKMSFDYERGKGSTSSILTRTNRAVLASTVNSNFVTMFFCSIDRKTSVMRCCSAGHFPAVIYNKAGGDMQLIKPRGKPLGWLDDPGIEEIEVQLSPGDRLVLYTDGIPECCNAKGKLFGGGAFRDYIMTNTDKTPELFCENLIKTLKKFSDADFFDDDISLIVFDVLPE